jgi:hypothetical protein
MTPPETLYAKTEDGHVGYQVVGNSRLDLVFIPWWVGNIDVMWEEASLARFLRRLATLCRLAFRRSSSGATTSELL